MRFVKILKCHQWQNWHLEGHLGLILRPTEDSLKKPDGTHEQGFIVWCQGKEIPLVREQFTYDFILPQGVTLITKYKKEVAA